MLLRRQSQSRRIGTWKRMILSINGWPGVGKLTVGSQLAGRLNGRLLDNHTLINVAKALTDYGTPAYYDAIRSVRQIAFGHILALPAHVPVVLTHVLATGGPFQFAEEHWKSIRGLATERGAKLLSVTLDCDPAEQARRIVSIERRALKKMHDPAQIIGLREGRSLLDYGADFSVTIDNTGITAADCADQIIAWAQSTLSEI